MLLVINFSSLPLICQHLTHLCDLLTLQAMCRGDKPSWSSTSALAPFSKRAFSICMESLRIAKGIVIQSYSYRASLVSLMQYYLRFISCVAEFDKWCQSVVINFVDIGSQFYQIEELFVSSILNTLLQRTHADLVHDLNLIQEAAGGSDRGKCV